MGCGMGRGCAGVRISGLARMATTSVFSRAMISGAVPPVAKSPCQATASKPRKPLSRHGQACAVG